MPRPQVSDELIDEIDARVAPLVRVDVAELAFEQKIEILLEELDSAGGDTVPTSE